jgi:hypothetical protein
MCRFSNTVLLEGAIDGVAGKESFSAEWLICLLAERAVETCAIDPLEQRTSVDNFENKFAS